MKLKYFFSILLFFIFSVTAFAQSHGTHMEGEAQIFGILELPFLIIALFFSFLTARNLKGGKFGTGMNLLAWGFSVMAVGHLHMQIDHLYDFNLFKEILGEKVGNYAWYIALILTWGLSALGFYKIYNASKV